MDEVHSFCTLCRSQCGTINVVDNGRLVAVRPDPTHPTGQAVCLKGKAGPEIVAANNRILYPMRRTRPKGDPDPGWKRISWDEALDLCAENLDRIRRESGPEAVAFAVTTKSGTAIADGIEWVDRFIRVFGSPNVAGAVDVCNWHKDVAHRFTFGVGMPVADYANAGLILLWGHNPTSTWLAQADAIARGRAAGAALIVVDPRATPLASEADVWLQVRPSTDAALALGLSNILIRDGTLDVDFVRRWTNAPMLVRDSDGQFLRQKDVDPAGGNSYIAWNARGNTLHEYDPATVLSADAAGELALMGRYEVRLTSGSTISCRPAFDQFSQACRVWTPGKVEEVTGVPPDKLKAAATLLAEHRRIAYHAWNGVGQSTNATQTERAIATLYALRGCFDDIGCNRILAKQPANKVDAISLIPKSQLQKALGIDKRPIGPPAEGRVKPIDVYRALATGRPYPVRGLVGFGTNHLLTQGDTDEIQRGLESAEFHVHCDIVETPTARFADVVLPVSTPWERESLRIGFEISEAAENLIQLRPAVVRPRGEARSDIELVFELAKRLGMGESFFGGDVEAAWNYMLAPLGISTADLRASGGRIVRPLKHATRKYERLREGGVVSGFPTETKRVELYSELLLRNGQSPVPVHLSSEADRTRYPLMLTSMKSGYFCHSQHHGVASLRRRASLPTLRLHPQLAARKGIVEGQWVEVRSQYGKTSFIAEPDDTLMEDVLAAEFGWWEGCEPLGKPSFPYSGPRNSNFNALVSADRRDPVSGSVSHKAVPCEVAPLQIAHPLKWPGFRRFRVHQLHREASAAVTVNLAPSGGGPLPDYEAGQYIRIRVRHPDTGEYLTRAYSLTAASTIPGRSSYQICVGRSPNAEPRSSLSRIVHEQLQEGDVLEVEAPNGSFTLPLRSSVPVVLIATGIGITPFTSYLQSLGTGDVMPRVNLLYGNRNATEHAFAELLRALARKLPRLTVKNFYSQPLPSDVAGSDYEAFGRLSADCIEASLIDDGARFYMCGSDAMIEAVRAGLIRRGVRKFNIFSEAFVSPVLLSDHSTGPCTIKFRRSKVEFTWTPGDGTLLDCIEKLGLRAPSGCRVGQCESCAVRVVSGRTMQLSGTTPEEPDVVLTCQGVPLGDLILDL